MNKQPSTNSLNAMIGTPCVLTTPYGNTTVSMYATDGTFLCMMSCSDGCIAIPLEYDEEAGYVRTLINGEIVWIFYRWFAYRWFAKRSSHFKQLT